MNRSNFRMAFSWTVGMNDRCDLNYEKLVCVLSQVCLCSPNLNPERERLGDRGKGVPSFDEMVDFALVEVDFDDPTTNVRGRRALAIAKPTPRGY